MYPIMDVHRASSDSSILPALKKANTYKRDMLWREMRERDEMRDFQAKGNGKPSDGGASQQDFNLIRGTNHFIQKTPLYEQKGHSHRSQREAQRRGPVVGAGAGTRGRLRGRRGRAGRGAPCSGLISLLNRLMPFDSIHAVTRC